MTPLTRVTYCCAARCSVWTARRVPPGTTGENVMTAADAAERMRAKCGGKAKSKEEEESNVPTV